MKESKKSFQETLKDEPSRQTRTRLSHIEDFSLQINFN